MRSCDLCTSTIVTSELGSVMIGFWQRQPFPHPHTKTERRRHRAEQDGWVPRLQRKALMWLSKRMQPNHSTWKPVSSTHTHSQYSVCLYAQVYASLGRTFLRRISPNLNVYLHTSVHVPTARTIRSKRSSPQPNIINTGARDNRR